MRVREHYTLPEDKQHALRKAIVLEWWTLGSLLTIIAVMYLALGSSQAMKTALIEDMLSMTPPVMFLIAVHFSGRAATERFPYGFHRSMMLSFLVASVAVLVVGLYLLYGGVEALLRAEHPTLGRKELFGWSIWSGWLMIAALIYSVIPPMILGHRKLPLAKEVHEKTLHADAAMNKADWMTGVAAVIGVLGIGLGWWWADAAAACFISLSVIKDGASNSKRAMIDLMDSRPTSAASGKPLELEQRIEQTLRDQSDIADVSVRLREDGHVISGEIFVMPNTAVLSGTRSRALSDLACDLDWRLHNLVVMPVDSPQRRD